MVEIIKYVFYRIARVACKYELMGEKAGLSYAWAYLTICLVSNVFLFVMVLIYFVWEIPPIKTSEIFLKYILVPLLLLLPIIIHVDEQAIYREMDEKCRNEDYATLKGIDVSSYIIMTFVLLFLFMIAF